MKFKTFTAEALLAADMNDLIMRQVVIQVDNHSERDTIPAPEEGMLCYVLSLGSYEYFNGTTWATLLGAPSSADWITYTATLSAVSGSFSVGSGGSAMARTRYKWVNGSAFIDYRFVLGTSGAAVGTGPIFTLPFAAALQIPRYAVVPGDGNLYDLSATAMAYSKARIYESDPTKIILTSYAGSFATIAAGSPWTWAAGDIFSGQFFIDPA